MEAYFAPLFLFPPSPALNTSSPFSTPTSTTVPGGYFPPRISVASGFWTSFWNTRFIGRAP